MLCLSWSLFILPTNQGFFHIHHQVRTSRRDLSSCCSRQMSINYKSPCRIGAQKTLSYFNYQSWTIGLIYLVSSDWNILVELTLISPLPVRPFYFGLSSSTLALFFLFLKVSPHPPGSPISHAAADLHRPAPTGQPPATRPGGLTSATVASTAAPTLISVVTLA